MTREEAVKWLKAISTKTVVFGWDDYASQESQKEIRERCEKAFGEAIDLAIEALSADAVHGEWTQISPAKIYECSVCHHNVLTDYIDTYNYCPNCGARMENK